MKRIISLVVLFLVSATSVSAANLGNAFSAGSDGPLKNIAEGAGYQGDSGLTLEGQIGAIITVILSMLGVLFLGLTIYAGFIWMTAQGNQAQVDKARNVLTRAIIGLVIVIMSYSISYFIIEKLGSGQLNNLGN